MKYVKLVIYAGFLALVVPPFCMSVLDDFLHPQRWDGSMVHDPWVYLPVLGAVLAVAAGLIVHLVWKECHYGWRLHQMEVLLQEALRRRRNGEHQEADRLLDEFERLFTKVYGRSPDSYLVSKNPKPK
jgi:hypothetical protein